MVDCCQWFCYSYLQMHLICIPPCRREGFFLFLYCILIFFYYLKMEFFCSLLPLCAQSVDQDLDMHLQMELLECMTRQQDTGE